MAWDQETSTRRHRLPSDWKTRRAAVRARASGQCEHIESGLRCLVLGAECDHIVPGDDHNLTNLQWLCRDHHAAKTKVENAQSRWRYRQTRETERHPGLR